MTRSAFSYNRSGRIPGVSGRKIPGFTHMPSPPSGIFQTSVPWQSGNGTEWGSAIFREYHRQQVRDKSGRFGGGWGFAWQGLEGVANNMENWAQGNLQNLRKAVDQLANEIRAYMQENAPWEDRTGDARRELQTQVVWNDETHFTIWLGHGKDIYYGIWLEVRWGGKFAIIVPTAQRFGPMLENKIRTTT